MFENHLTMMQKISLRKATLIKRYKRFLADVILADDSQTTIHVANTGAMTGCANPGDIIWYSTSTNAKRKYPFSWELTEKANGDIICVNTLRANQLVEEALTQYKISELNHLFLTSNESTNDAYTIQREVKYGSENSKIDFLLNSTKAKAVTPAYIEVKSVTLLESLEDSNQEESQGYFPDSVTIRGQKHLRELMQISQEDKQAVLLFCVLHSGINSVKVAAHIDKKYAQLLAKSAKLGVKIIAYQAEFLFYQTNNQLSEANVTITLTSNTPVTI